MAMTDSDMRDIALRAVSLDAASAGNASIVKQTIGKFYNSDKRNQTAAACVKGLVTMGQF